MAGFNLGKYHKRLSPVLVERYGRDFKDGFERIETVYAPVRSGAAKLTIDHVMQLFDPDLPFVETWTKPDETVVAANMQKHDTAGAVTRVLENSRIEPYRYDRDLVGTFLSSFRELSLAALVLEHVDPAHFAVCSHHLASLLSISGRTVSDFYAEYCRELLEWSGREWPGGLRLSVRDTEYALWSWYRDAYQSKGKSKAQARSAQREFHADKWVQGRKAQRIAQALTSIDPLDLARSFLGTEPTVASIIAWRELNVAVNRILEHQRQYPPNTETIWQRFDRLVKKHVPKDWDAERFRKLWGERNRVMKQGSSVAQARATEIVDGVELFLRHNASILGRDS